MNFQCHIFSNPIPSKPIPITISNNILRYNYFTLLYYIYYIKLSYDIT